MPGTMGNEIGTHFETHLRNCARYFNLYFFVQLCKQLFWSFFAHCACDSVDFCSLGRFPDVIFCYSEMDARLNVINHAPMRSILNLVIHLFLGRQKGMKFRCVTT